MLETGFRVYDSLSGYSASVMDGYGVPHGLAAAFFKESLPTMGLLIAHVLTKREVIHRGQLSAGRRGVGLPGVLKL